MHTHLTENNLEPYHRLLINGGKLHVVVGHRSYDIFSAKKAPGINNNTFTITENKHHLNHYNISVEVATTWIAEAHTLMGGQ